MKKTDFGNNEEFINNYLTLKSSRKMGELYGCTKNGVLRHAREIGFDINSIDRNYKLTKQQKAEIIQAYNTTSSTELAKRYNVSRGMITKLWHDQGLTGKIVNNPKTTEIDLTNQQFGLWTVLYKTEKRNAGGIIYWHCRCACGKEKDVLGSSLRLGRSQSCGLHSNISRGNTKIADLLDRANIEYQIEKTFIDCCDKKPLPFDFFVNNLYLIEYDGEQHFDPNTFFDYEYTHYHDEIKNQYCQQNNIPLIRIPYTHYNQLCLEDLLLPTTQFLYNNADIKLQN